jgi:hypothetical protein
MERWELTMRSAIPIAVPATAALVAATLMQVSTASAHRICGATTIGVSVQVREEWHAQTVAWALWGNCARKYYGREWSSLEMSKDRTKVHCYDVRAWRRYYGSNGFVTCDSTIDRPRWVCFLRAIPCRYRSDDDD